MKNNIDGTSNLEKPLSLKISEEKKIIQLDEQHIFLQFIDNEIILCQENKGIFSLIMLEIDYLHAIKPLYDIHLFEKVFKIVGKLIKHNTLLSDVICHYEKNKFCIVALNAIYDEALEKAKRYRLILEESKIPYDRKKRISIACTFAVTQHSPDLRNSRVIIDKVNTLLKNSNNYPKFGG